MEIWALRHACCSAGEFTRRREDAKKGIVVVCPPLRLRVTLSSGSRFSTQMAESRNLKMRRLIRCSGEVRLIATDETRIEHGSGQRTRRNEKCEVSDQWCVMIFNVLPGGVFSVAKNGCFAFPFTASSFPNPVSCPDPCSIRVSSVAKTFRRNDLPGLPNEPMRNECSPALHFSFLISHYPFAFCCFPRIAQLAESLRKTVFCGFGLAATFRPA